MKKIGRPVSNVITPENLEFIRINYGKFTVGELAGQFNVTVGALAHIISRKGIKRTTSYKGGDLENAGFKMKYRNYKAGAKTRGFDFSLSFDEFKAISVQNCQYCGEVPAAVSPWNFPTAKVSDEFKISSTIQFNGIDRVDNSIGYTLINCVAACTLCNMMKKALSVDDFLNHAEKVCKYNKMDGLIKMDKK